MTNFESLVLRLRGFYTVPVNDGAGPLNGSSTFTRQFNPDDLPPIHAESADAIEELMRLARELWKSRRNMAYGPNAERMMIEEFPWLKE